MIRSPFLPDENPPTEEFEIIHNTKRGKPRLRKFRLIVSKTTYGLNHICLYDFTNGITQRSVACAEHNDMVDEFRWPRKYRTLIKLWLDNDLSMPLQEFLSQTTT